MISHIKIDDTLFPVTYINDMVIVDYPEKQIREKNVSKDSIRELNDFIRKNNIKIKL